MRIVTVVMVPYCKEVFMRLFFGLVLCFAMAASPSVSQGTDQAARELLVEAIQASKAAEQTEDPAARLDALERAAAALDRIEREYATTDTGIALISGAEFGAFDPGSVRRDLEDTRNRVALSDCETTYSATCVMELMVDAFATIEGKPADEIRQETPLLFHVMAAASSGGGLDESEIADVWRSEDMDQIGLIYETLPERGYLMELLDLHAALPADHPLRDHVPTVEDLKAALPDIMSNYPSMAALAGISRALDAGIEGLEPLVLAVGSTDQIRSVLSARSDPAQAFDRWLADGTLRPLSLGMDRTIAVLAEMGMPELALASALDPEIALRQSYPETLVAAFPEEDRADYVKGALDGLEQPEWRWSFFWSSFPYLSPDAVREIAGEVGAFAFDLDEGSPRGEAIATAAFAAGKAGREDLLETVAALPPEMAGPDDRDLFETWFAAGTAAAPDGSADRFVEVMAQADERARLDFLDKLVSSLVAEGRLEDASDTLDAFGVFDKGLRADEFAPDRARLAALVGRLDWAEEGLRTGSIKSYAFSPVEDGYMQFLTAAQEHGYDLGAAPQQIARLLLSVEPEAADAFAETLSASNSEGYPGAGELVFKAAMELPPEPMAYTLQSAFLGAAELQAP